MASGAIVAFLGNEAANQHTVAAWNVAAAWTMTFSITLPGAGDPRGCYFEPSQGNTGGALLTVLGAVIWDSAAEEITILDASDQVTFPATPGSTHTFVCGFTGTTETKSWDGVQVLSNPLTLTPSGTAAILLYENDQDADHGLLINSIRIDQP